MGGIAGYLGGHQPATVLSSMVRKLSHRGSDGEGFYNVPPVSMGARRFAMTGGATGGQPLYTPDRTMAIIFDGEIYNYKEEREKLVARGHVFATQSDTEVILRLYEEYGVGCLAHLRGMFAFVIHDQRKNLVFMARDRMGIKPFYYMTTQSGDFVFGSEIKALLEHPGVTATPDLIAIDAYLTMRFSPGPESVFKGVRKLPAGHFMIWNHGLHVHTEAYWKWDNFKAPEADLKTDNDYQERFNALFDESVRLNAEGDAKAGVFLSGSISSAAIVASLARQSSDNVSTFSVGYDTDSGTLASARAAARHFGADHHEVVCSPADMEKLPEIIWSLDEPVADAVVVPVHLLSQMARRSTKVCLSSGGADELLAGHPAHRSLLRARKMPKIMYSLASPLAAMMPSEMLGKLTGYPGKMGWRGRRRLALFMHEMRTSPLIRQYHALMTLFDREDKQIFYDAPMKPVMETFMDAQRETPSWPTFLSSMVALQQRNWLQDGTLPVIDKLSMASGLEARVPFLDHRLAEFLLSVPDHLKRSEENSKILLRNYAATRLPPAEHFKGQTFPPPLGKLLETRPLKDMVDMCLSERSVRKRGLFDYDGVRYLLSQAREGDYIHAEQVFSLLSLEIWFRIFIDHEKGWISS